MLILTLALLSTACQTLPSPKAAVKSSDIQGLQTLYDYRLAGGKTLHPLNLDDLGRQLRDYDVIFFGEFHGNQASHLLEAQLLAKLYSQNPEIIVSMEMFERQQQAILNRYLDGEIGETYLVNEAPTWPNYKADYRPLVEFAKQNLLKVVAANAPGETVRCVGRYGLDYLDHLNETQKQQVAEDDQYRFPQYKQRYFEFMDKMRKLPEQRKEFSYQAQLLRDRTMAESIDKALRASETGTQLIHFNGSFHSEDRLGTVAALQARRPDLKIAVITPLRGENNPFNDLDSDKRQSNDVFYWVLPQPAEFVDNAYKMQQRRAQFQAGEAKPCLVEGLEKRLSTTEGTGNTTPTGSDSNNSGMAD
ncbi:ChaN family lipoprotein [Thiomicrorhabdus heinhorstiae]|uniref:ChaN family lipoprotein n=1 Tax=Thiomicrorhabdus heinhorstiae TaxID=2748010 RepID=A0ABS0C193_9GAMM|nr:ChaN family lipoprotein [Thiomicrorhabdus heinhorstiae]MBF6058851.1 ChaN family lipoprotein [Thiomicrorhabdus heinhorstiae]